MSVVAISRVRSRAPSWTDSRILRAGCFVQQRGLHETAVDRAAFAADKFLGNVARQRNHSSQTDNQFA